MSNYSDTILRAITKNCRAEIRKEFREEIAKLKKEVTPAKKEAASLRAENRKLKKQLAEYKKKENPITKKLQDLELVEVHAKNAIKKLEELKERKLGSFLTSPSPWYSEWESPPKAARARRAYNKVKREMKQGKKRSK